MLEYKFLLVSIVCFCVFVFGTYAAESIAENHELGNGERVKTALENSIDTSIFSFGMELMKKLAKKSGASENVFVSPLGAYFALSMLHLAAEEETRARLNKVMKLTNMTTDIPKTLGDTLKKVANQTSDQNKIFPDIVISNGLFVQEGSPPVDSSYVRILKKYYDDNVNITNLDFHGHANESTEAINLWISRKTKNRISDFFNQSLANATDALLTSTFYFKAGWKNSFTDSVTELVKFKTGQNEILVPMLQKVHEIPYYNDTQLKFEAIELSLEGEEHAMTFVLPHLSQTVDNLTDHGHLLDFKKYENESKKVFVHCKIPAMMKAGLSSKNSLLDSLQLEGISPRITSNGNVTISEVNQAIHVQVDENAGASTTSSVMEYVRVKGRQLFSHPIQFILDRPFIVYILHKPTHTLMFSGIVRKPPGNNTLSNQMRNDHHGRKRFPAIIPIPIPIPMSGPKMKSPDIKIKIKEPKVKVKTQKIKYKG